MPALLWTTDSEARLTWLAGAGFAPISLPGGVLAADFAGKPVEHLFSSLGVAASPRGAHLTALQGQACSFEIEVDGRVLQAHIEPARSTDGGVTGVIGVALDLTERMATERALRFSEHSYRSLIDEAPYAICRCTAGGQLLQVNRAMLEMLGYGPASEAELLIRDMPEVFGGSFEAFRTALLYNEKVNGMETTWLRRDGGAIQVAVTGRLIRDHSGAVSHLDILAEDVTAKKHLEEQLMQAQKMQAVGQLAGGVAHDFNNLLTVIGGQVEMVLRATIDPDLRERLTEVSRAADHAAVLTRQLLAFSRRQVLQTRVVDLNDVIQHLLGILKRLIKENVELVFLPGNGLAWVNADPYQIEQVLINLTVNAQDAMPGGGRLTIETGNLCIERESGFADMEAGDYVQVVVRDTGHGMDRDVQARIFEPFFTTKRMGKGSGLGLSMAYGIVKQSGGHIRVESQPGEGATFTMYLPQVAPPQAIAAAPAPLALPLRGSETILLAEDESAVRELLGSFLQHLGYRVLRAADGMAAIAVAEGFSGTIHLLLSDFVMPRLGGRELAGVLRKVTPQLKVIFLSGYAGHTVPGEELDIPDARFLAKPLSLDVLSKTIREVLDEART